MAEKREMIDKYSKVYKKLNELRLQEIDKMCEIYDDGHLPSSVALNIPSNFVEVVRCKDCKHWDSDALCCSRENHYIVNAEVNDYCSYGERKDA